MCTIRGLFELIQAWLRRTSSIGGTRLRNADSAVEQRDTNVALVNDTRQVEVLKSRLRQNWWALVHRVRYSDRGETKIVRMLSVEAVHVAYVDDRGERGQRQVAQLCVSVLLSMPTAWRRGCSRELLVRGL